jgi:hypothetical protein
MTATLNGEHVAEVNLVAPCPDWCQERQAGCVWSEVDGRRQRIHYLASAVAPWVEVNLTETEGEPLGAPMVICESDSERLTPQNARIMASELERMADLAEGLGSPRGGGSSAKVSQDLRGGWTVPAWAAHMDLVGPSGQGDVDAFLDEHHGEVSYSRQVEGGYMTVDGWIKLDLQTREVRLELGEPELYATGIGDSDGDTLAGSGSKLTVAEAREIAAALSYVTHPELRKAGQTLAELLAIYDGAVPPVGKARRSLDDKLVDAFSLGYQRGLDDATVKTDVDEAADYAGR